MKRTVLTRIVCLILVMISFYSYSLHQGISAIAAGEAFDDVAEAPDTQDNDDIDIESLYSSDGTVYEALDYSLCISEETELRGQYEKHFQRDDRTYEAVMYPYPVHYNKNGTWEDIDNTLIKGKDSEGNLIYKNTANEFNTEFSSIYTEETSLVNITREDYSIGFNFINLGGEGVAETKNNSYKATKDVQEIAMQMRFPAQLSSPISYEDITDNISLTYDITPVGVTELIELRDPDCSESFASQYGRYLTDPGTPVDKLALTPGNSGNLTKYVVKRPVTFRTGIISSCEWGPGGGIQYFSWRSVRRLVQFGIMSVLE